MIDEGYPEKLIEINLKIMGEYLGSSVHHNILCLECDNLFQATPKSKIQNFRKHKYTGCPKCTMSKRHKQKRLNNISRIKKQFEILSEWNGQYAFTSENNEDKINLTVRNKKCGHVFTSKASNLLSRNVKCPTCNNLAKRKKFQKFQQKRHQKYIKTASSWQIYKSQVESETKKTYRKYKHIINPNNLPRGLAGEDGAYHLDHILPIRYCFDTGITVGKCSSLSNLQMLLWEENLSKKDKVE